MTAGESQPGSAESFRDSLGIVNQEGGRRWLYPQRPSGRFHRIRIAATAVLFALLLGVPFVRVSGHPLFLFDFAGRTLILFGKTFGPHDFYLVGLMAITSIVFIILFTVTCGRLFCGWICPQTVLMEMVFRKIDYWIEGDHRAQQRLKESAWNLRKVTRKGSKYAAYALVSFIVALALFAHSIGVERLREVLSTPPSEHPGVYAAIVGFSILLYWIFSWFREQACILVCPYGRLQGVLLDRNSIVIGYDYKRGEPRGKLQREPAAGQGDCIDCHQCVAVCPTGIDIRNGTQLECVNCTACIDACDAIMEKVHKPRGLIRYASASAIAEKQPFKWTGRMVGYSVVLGLLIVVLGYLLASRTDYDVTVLRTPGMFFQERPDGSISNVYDITIVNKTFSDADLSVHMVSPPGTTEVVGGSLKVKPQGVLDAKLLLSVPPGTLRALSTSVTLAVTAGDGQVQEIHTTFLGPVRRTSP
jgi:cytochrome c oxidase accessory protein FixG